VKARIGEEIRTPALASLEQLQFGG
jgi:hypothetical protein